MTYTTRVLCVGLAAACAAAFLLLWLVGLDVVTEPAPLIIRAPEPCIQLSDLPMRKAYRQSDIDRLCTHQQRDERFHANPTRPKRVQPE